MAVDNTPHGRRESARHEIGQTALPGLEGLAPAAELEGHELLLAIGKDRDHAQGRDAHDLARTPDPQGQGVEVQAEDVEIGQRPRAPGLQLDLQGPHHPRDGTLRQRGALQQGPKGAPEPPGVGAGQVGGDHGFVDLAQPALVAGQQGRGPFPRTGRGEQARPGHREGQGPVGPVSVRGFVPLR